MSETLFLLINQENAILSRNGEWLGLKDEKQFYKTPNRDEAINLKVEHAVKDADTRISIVEAHMTDGSLVFADGVSVIAEIPHADLDDNVDQTHLDLNDKTESTMTKATASAPIHEANNTVTEKINDSSEPDSSHPLDSQDASPEFSVNV